MYGGKLCTARPHAAKGVTDMSLSLELAPSTSEKSLTWVLISCTPELSGEAPLDCGQVTHALNQTEVQEAA